MAVRRDFWNGINDKSKVKFFPATQINTLVVSYLHPEQNEIWVQSFYEYSTQLLEFLSVLEEQSTKYNVFGVWPGKTRSDTFPLNKDVVKTLCKMNSNQDNDPNT